MRRYISALGAAIIIAGAWTYAQADLTYTQGAGTTLFDFVCFSTKHCPVHVPINSAGTEIMTAATPGQVTGANGTFPATQSGTWTVQPGNTANTTPWLFTPSDGTNAMAFKAASTAAVAADKSGVVQESPNSQLSTATGAVGDSAWVSGNGSIIALLKNIANGVASAIAAGTNYIGQVGLNATASGGWSMKHFIAAASNNATNLKASAGIVHAVQVFGVGSAPAYLKFCDKATACTCGSDAVVKSIMIPAASTAANGAGAIATVIDAQFSTGISYCVVTGIADADNTSVTAATFDIEIDWK